MTDLRRVSKTLPPGQPLEIPDSAMDVTVKSDPSDGGVRVSYLLPLQTVEFTSDDEEAASAYVY